MTVNTGDANISKIRLTEQGSDPATPASGFGYLYPKTDGGLYFKNDGGTVVGPFAAALDLITGTSTALDGASALVIGNGLSFFVTGTVGFIGVRDIGARVYNNANIATNTDEATLMTYNVETYDTDNIHDLVTNTGRLTCRTAGKYSIIANVSFASNIVGYRQVYIQLNGATVLAISSQQAITSSSVNTRIVCSTQYTLVPTDYLEVFVIQNSTGALNVLTAAVYSPSFMMQKIG